MEVLPDPLKDRVMKNVPPPPHKYLDRKIMFPEKNGNKPDWKSIKEHLAKEGRIEKQDIIKLVNMTNKILKNESNLLTLDDPLSIIGDVHGQYYDLIKIFELAGNPENSKYLFLGDFVDRGSFSIEVLILLYSFKCCFSKFVFFLRGNHECRQMTSFFNFRDECLYKYDQEIYDIFMDSFDLFPLSCIVNGKFLALHGGISPELKTLENLKKLDRFKEPPRQGLLCDILWADPIDNDEGACENIYKANEVRGCSWFYGLDAVTKFLDRNNLLSVIRAHEAQIEGYKMHRWNGASDFPAVITIFSAPNYCDVYNNKGAIIKFENNTLNIQQFNYTPHPYLLPNFMDIFTWSIPFVAEKINELLYNILKPSENDVDDENEEDETALNKDQLKKITESHKDDKPLQLSQKGEILKNRIKFVGKMVKLQRILRENNEQIVKLKGFCPDNKIPKGLLIQGGDAIKDALHSFNKAKKADLINEKRPDKLNKNKKPGN